MTASGAGAAGARPGPHPALDRRRRDVERARGRNRRLAMLAGVTGLGCAIVGYWLATGPLLGVRDVRVSQYDRADAPALRAAVAAAADRGGSLLVPPIADIRAAAIRFPWVEDVTVARDLPLGAVVQVRLAEPVGVAVPAAGAPVLVNRRGQVMGPAAGAKGLPRFRIPGTAPAPGAEVPRAASPAMRLILLSRPATAARFRNLRMQGGNLVGVLPGGVMLRLGPPTRLPAKARSLQAVLDWLAATPAVAREATYLDLAIPEHPALGTGPLPAPDAAATATPAAAGAQATADPAVGATTPAQGTQATTDPSAQGATQAGEEPAAGGAGTGVTIVPDSIIPDAVSPSTTG